MDRLDKILGDAGIGSRKDCEKLIRRGYVTVNGEVVRTASLKVADSDVVAIDGEVVPRHRDVVCIMNKVAGLVTSTEDGRNRTVMEHLPQDMQVQKVLPVGRLDKDTEGLLVFSNQGDLIHRLISPKHEVPKVYYVEHDGDVTSSEVEKAFSGIALKDGSVCRSADLMRIAEGRSLILIRQGMYHQVKRMYAAMGLHVNYLKRVQIGSLVLGDLAPGEVRELSESEIALLSDKDARIVFTSADDPVYSQSPAFQQFLKLTEVERESDNEMEDA